MSLKKEFSKKNVNRMRNLIKGKNNSATGIQLGYRKTKARRKEGDVWEEDGRTWTINDGIRENVIKHEETKKKSLMPLTCPNCNKVMKKRNDRAFYRIQKMCFDCVIVFETKLKREGKYEQYEIDKKNKEIDNIINLYREWTEDRIKEGLKSHMTENGDIEKWEGKLDEKLIRESMELEIEKLESLKQ